MSPVLLPPGCVGVANIVLEQKMSSETQKNQSEVRHLPDMMQATYHGLQSQLELQQAEPGIGWSAGFVPGHCVCSSITKVS